MIETQTLNALLLEAFSGKITWLQASMRYPLDEFIDAFHRTRALMEKTVGDMTDSQVAYTADANPTWSISEAVTHLIYSQGFYHNQLLDITTSQLPHILEAAKGFGEGAKQNISAEELRTNLGKATATIYDAIEKTRGTHDPKRITRSPFFGDVNYETWILLMLGHEVDHIRQSILMRRLARAATRTAGDAPPAEPKGSMPS